jgi:hypothetical protein
MTIVLIVYLLMVLVWLIGVGVVAYHVFKYRMPGDVTVKAFWAFLVVSMATLLFVVYFISGADWGGV